MNGSGDVPMPRRPDVPMVMSDWLIRIGPCRSARETAERFLRLVPESGLFGARQRIAVARAPARLDLIGGIADYSGSLVLEWPLAEATHVAVQRDPQPMVQVRSLGSPADRAFTTPLSSLLSLDYPDARARFLRDPADHWAAYVAGTFIVLARERGVRFTGGARILVASSIPEGKGVASSAALEVATMMAVAAAYDVTVTPDDLAVLCQRVENSVAGAPCGVMDQMTSSIGEAGRLLLLLCRPAEVEGHLELAGDLALWGIDSGVRHAVTGADYSTVRAAAFMGRRMLAEVGIEVTYLAELTPQQFAAVEAELPENITGREFVDRYRSTGDSATTIDPDRSYPVRAATAHPIQEHARVREFAALLREPRDAGCEHRLGELMYASHASYSACGLGTPVTDALVTLVRRDGPKSGLYGAKITGGGSGGTVAILGRRDAGPLVQAIAARYARHWGHAAQVFSGTSPGAVTLGIIFLES